MHGSIYHMIGSLQPQAEQGIPRFAQLYIHDTEHEADNRISHISGLDREIVAGFQDMLHHHNPFVRQIRAAATQNAPEMQLRIVTGALENCFVI